MLQQPQIVLTDSVGIGGVLQGIALRAHGMPRRERERVHLASPRLRAAIRRGDVPEALRDRAFAYRRQHNLVTTVGKQFLVDAWQNIVEMEIMKFHGVGTGNTSDAAVGDTALNAESTTAMSGDVRATGTLAEGATGNIFRSVGTSLFDVVGPTNVTEWGLFSVVTPGSGSMFARVGRFTAIPMGNGESIQWTYECTLN